MPEKTFPDTLKRVRKANCLSQTQLASKIGVSFMTMRRYETGESFPNQSIMELILLELSEKDLADTWAHDWKELYPAEPLSAEDIAKAIYGAKNAAMRTFIVNVGKKESMDFIKPYHAITEMLLQLNDDGLKAVHDFTKLMTQIPDHQK